jgi:hypothetical protein
MLYSFHFSQHSHFARSTCLLLVVFAAQATLCPAARAHSMSSTENLGWITLFNGKDLAGWQDPRNPKSPLAPSTWSVDDHAITNAPGAADLATVDSYTDFDLTLEYKTAKGGNGGVYLRGRIKIQIRDSFGKEKLSAEDDGAVYGLPAPAINASKPAGQWNTLEVRLLHDLLSVKLNGQLLHDNVHVKDRVADALPGGLLDPGPLRFQGGNSKVWYRNVKLRPITPRAKPSTQRKTITS